MPVRSSVCTYSPATSGLSNSNKYSTSVLPTASSLSVGQYKPLTSSSSSYATASSSSAASTSPRYSGSASSSSSTLSTSGYGGSGHSPSRYSLSSSSSYSPTSSLNSSSYSSLSSTSSLGSSNYTTPASLGTHFTSSSSSSGGYYRPLNSARNSFSSSRHNSNGTTTHDSPSRFSTGSTSSSSSISSATSSLLDRTESFLNSTNSTHNPTLTSRTHYYTSSPTSLSSATLANRRLSSSLIHAQRKTSLSGAASSLEETTKLPSDVPKGLINLGNTCYMNAVIQSLYSIDLIRNHLFSSSHYYDKVLTSELSDLFNSMKNNNNNSYGGSAFSPSSFKQTFSRHQAKFSGLGQQDSQEFLRYLINGIHEECNRASKRPKRSPNQPARLPPKTAEEAWQQYREIVDDSPLVDIVVGQLCSTIVCSVCQNKSYCWDPFWDLSLPLARNRYTCKLSDVVQDFTAKETLDMDERPVCEQCKKATKSTKQIKVCRLPPVMILHLKKFTNDGYKLSKPEVSIDQVLSFDDNTQYNLTACISHHGHSSSSGHYTAHCKYSSRWIHFNDDRSRRILPELAKHSFNSPLTLQVPRYNQVTIESRARKNRRLYFTLTELRGYLVNLRGYLTIRNLVSCSKPFNDSCTSATSDIFCVTGGISTITGVLIACFGVYPKNQARIRLYLECFGCAMIVVGVLILLLSLKMRSKSVNHHHQRHHHHHHHHHHHRQHHLNHHHQQRMIRQQHTESQSCQAPVFDGLLKQDQLSHAQVLMKRSLSVVSLDHPTEQKTTPTNCTTRQLRFKSIQLKVFQNQLTILAPYDNCLNQQQQQQKLDYLQDSARVVAFVAPSGCHKLLQRNRLTLKRCRSVEQFETLAASPFESLCQMESEELDRNVVGQDKNNLKRAYTAEVLLEKDYDQDRVGLELKIGRELEDDKEEELFDEEEDNTNEEEAEEEGEQLEGESEESPTTSDTSSWLPPDGDDDEFYGEGGHQVAVEAALSTVLTVSTLVGFRVVSGACVSDGDQLNQHQVAYCCLHHAIQHKLSARKWVKKLKQLQHTAELQSVAEVEKPTPMLSASPDMT